MVKIKSPKPRKDAAFRWTDAEWAILEPMTEWERFEWMAKRIMAFDQRKQQKPVGDR